jgi:hypothetical protein
MKIVEFANSNFGIVAVALNKIAFIAVNAVNCDYTDVHLTNGTVIVVYGCYSTVFEEVAA